MYRFLLAKLHLDSLSDKTSVKAVRLALDQLPKGAEALKHAYEDALQRLQGQKTGFALLAKQIIAWLVCAARPLTVLELRYALAVEDDAVAIDKDNFPDADQMLNVCAGLVTIEEDSGIIRLVHYTTQEYFEQALPGWVPDAHANIVRTCLTYLSYNLAQREC